MKRLVGSLAAAGVGVGLVVLMRRRRGYAQTADLAPAPRVVVRNARGRVDVQAADVDRIRVTARMRRQGASLDVAREGDELCIGVVGGTCESLQLFVPRGTAVKVKVARGDVNVAGSDDIDVRVAKGSVNLADVAGRIRVRLAKGRVNAVVSRDRATSEVDVKNSIGGIAMIVPLAVRDGEIPFRVRSARGQVQIAAA